MSKTSLRMPNFKVGNPRKIITRGIVKILKFVDGSQHSFDEVVEYANSIDCNAYDLMDDYPLLQLTALNGRHMNCQYTDEIELTRLGVEILRSRV